MATRRMIANRAMRYGGTVLSAGDEFKASRQDARVLGALGRAMYAPGEIYKADEESAGPPVAAPVATPAPTVAPEPGPVLVEPEAELSDALDHDEDEQKGDSMAGQASTRARALTKVQLAAEYAKATGGKPDGRWNKNRLEQELEAVRGTYRRRDMRAED